MSDVYLAGPYYSDSKLIRSMRFKAHCKAAAWAMREGNTVFSPVAHGVPISMYGGVDECNHEFWMKQCFGFIPHCRAMYVLRLGGCDESRGVAAEIAEAHRLGIPVISVEVNVDSGDLEFRLGEEIAK